MQRQFGHRRCPRWRRWLLWGISDLARNFAAAVIANATTAGSVATAIAIATGNSLEAVVWRLPDQSMVEGM